MRALLLPWLTVGLLGIAACSSASQSGPTGGTAGSGGSADRGATSVSSSSSTGGTDVGVGGSGAGVGSTSAGTGGGPGAGGGGGAPAASARIVAYLPNYSGSYADWATSIDFSKMTHLNLAFATATSSNGWDLGASDQDVDALVTAAHARGTKVLASLGGGGGDQTVIARYKNPGNLDALVANLDAFVAAHGLDGVDVDIEDPGNLGASYSAFVDKVIATLHPEGKLVTAAVAQYLQDSMADETLHAFDFVNVMIYSSYADSVSALDYYAGTKAVPPSQLTLGVGFFGSDSDGNEYAYTDILAADGSAWSKDQATVQGKTVNYTGMATVKQLAEYSKGFGGTMFWELSQDTTDEHSLYKVIQGAL